MKLNNKDIKYGDRVLADLTDVDVGITILEVYYLAESKQINSALIAIPKPNTISFNDISGYLNYDYDLPHEHFVIKDFPSTFYSFWAIRQDSIKDLIHSNSIYTLENIIDQLESEIK